MKVEIYSRDSCVFCDKAKMRLAKYNQKIFMLDQDFTREEFFLKFPNAKTFPQIIINNKHIGTYNQLEQWLTFNNPDEDF